MWILAVLRKDMGQKSCSSSCLLHFFSVFLQAENETENGKTKPRKCITHLISKPNVRPITQSGNWVKSLHTPYTDVQEELRAGNWITNRNKKGIELWQ